MKTFEELTQAMDGCVQRVKRDRWPDVGEDFVQYENIVDEVDISQYKRRKGAPSLSYWFVKKLYMT